MPHYFISLQGFARSKMFIAAQGTFYFNKYEWHRWNIHI